MSEQKRKIGFTIACVNEFARKYQISSKEAFQYLFKFKGIAFIKENYDVEHTLDFETVLEDLGILCKKKWGYIMRLYHGSNIVIDNINLAMCRPYKDFGQGFQLTDIEEQAEKMAIRVARIYGEKPIENIYEIEDNFKDLKNLKIKDFEIQTTEEYINSFQMPKTGRTRKYNFQ